MGKKLQGVFILAAAEALRRVNRHGTVDPGKQDEYKRNRWYEPEPRERPSTLKGSDILITDVTAAPEPGRRQIVVGPREW